MPDVIPHPTPQPSRAERRRTLTHPNVASPGIAEQIAVLNLLNNGDAGLAEQAARRLLARFPLHSFGAKTAGAALAAQSRWDEAIVLYERALRSTTADWELHNNYANALKTVGRRDDAVTQYHRAIALAPQTTLEPHYNLGLTLIDLGRLSEAEQSLLHALVLRPEHALAHLNLANVCCVQGRLPEAESHYRAALLTLPESSAEAPKAHNNLGLCLRRQNRFREAEPHIRRALELQPEYATACSNFSEFMAAHGFMHDAVSLLRHAIALEPDHAEAHSNLLFTLAHVAESTSAQLLAEHIAFANHFETPLLAKACAHENSPDPHRPLRLGFVSADLRDHPLVRYLRPALTRLAERREFSLTAYSNNPHQDAETLRYREQFSRWRDVAHLDHEALAALIQRDQIDVLFDLSGHTGHNRLLTFARKPAPVQIAWMGYVGTTGLRSMDFVVGDRHLVPPHLREHFTERILDLPAATTFEPHPAAPEVNALPALRTGVFTFACLARTNKLNRETVALWSQILHAAPDARLMLATMSDGHPPQPVLAWFAEQGIGPDRLHFVHPRSVEDVLRLHSEIDLALDTSPYNGSTTSSHALWMGVPTLTLTGNTVPGRMGTALNAHTNLYSFNAPTPAAYVSTALRHMHDPGELAELRPTLRERFRRSPLQDHDAHVAALVEAVRGAWQQWCATQAWSVFT